jgi:hypothetical protein
MNTWSKKVELIANVAIIITALLLCTVVAKRYLLPGNNVAPAPANEEVRVGTKVSLPDVNWTQSKQTLLLALSEGCHFCAESAPFYQRLAREAGGRENLRLIAVLPQTADEGRKYLNTLGIPIDEVKQASLGSIGVRGTPTLLLVNSEGAIEKSWIGKLQPDKESEVLARLRL